LLKFAGAIKSDTGVQGLPCDEVCQQGKPCAPGVISGSANFVCITYNRTRSSPHLRENITKAVLGGKHSSPICIPLSRKCIDRSHDEAKLAIRVCSHVPRIAPQGRPTSHP